MEQLTKMKYDDFYFDRTTNTRVVSIREIIASVSCNHSVLHKPGGSSGIGTIPEPPGDPATSSKVVEPGACGSPGMITAPDALYRPVFLVGAPATLRKIVINPSFLEHVASKNIKI